jgi:hypothetical protein
MGAGGCDAIVGVDGFPRITHDGQTIHILFFGVRATDPEFCTYPNGQAAFSVGTSPSGDYELSVEMLYDHFPTGQEIITLEVIPFSVSGTALPIAASVPALSGASEIFLVAIFVLLGLVFLDALRGGTPPLASLDGWLPNVPGITSSTLHRNPQGTERLRGQWKPQFRIGLSRQHLPAPIPAPSRRSSAS